MGTLCNKNGNGQGRKIRKGIVQKYTTSVQQIDRTLGDKGENDGKEAGASVSYICRAPARRKCEIHRTLNPREVTLFSPVLVRILCSYIPKRNYKER